MASNSYFGTITPGFKTISSYAHLGSDVVDNLHFRVNVAQGKPDYLNISLDDLNGNVDIDLWRDLDRDGRIDPTKDIKLHSGVLAGNLDEALNVRLGYSGNYIAQIRALDGIPGMFRFKMTNTGQGPSDLLHGEKALGPLGYDPTVLRLQSIHGGDTANVYQFSMATAGNFNAGLTGLRTGTNVDMRLVQDKNNDGFIDAGEVIAKSDHSGNSDEFFNIQSLAAGNYFLQTNFKGDASAQYTLKLSNTGDAPSNLLPVRLDLDNLTRFTGLGEISLGSNRSTLVSHFKLEQQGNFNTAFIRNGSSTIRLVRDGNSNGIVDDGEVVYGSTADTGQEALNLFGLSAGHYYLQASLGDSGYATVAAPMSITGANPSNLLHGAANAGQLSKVPVVYRDSLGPMDAVDTYQFELQSTGNLNAALTHIGADADIGMRVVYDSNNNRRVDDGDTVYAEFGSGQSDRAINQRFQAGSYFLQAFTKNGVASDYTLKLSTTGDGPSNLLPTETAVGPIDGPMQFYGVVEGANTTDTYRFSLSHWRTVTFNLGDLNGNADLRLIRDANHNGIVDPGEEFKRAASLGSSPETITKTLEAGDYFAQVYAPTLEATSYTLSLA